MTFSDLEARLLERLRERLRRGEASERGLARLTGYTQPHVHNVLRGARRLCPDLADHLLRAARLELEDLLPAGEPAELIELPVSPPPGAWPFPARFLARFSEPVLLRVVPGQESSSPVMAPGDLVLLDRAEGARRRPGGDAVWALSVGGRTVFCRCRLAGNALVLLAGRPSRLPEHVPLARRNILDVVRGRVVWVGREWDLV